MVASTTRRCGRPLVVRPHFRRVERAGNPYDAKPQLGE
jgi:hypothetical protein